MKTLLETVSSKVRTSIKQKYIVGKINHNLQNFKVTKGKIYQVKLKDRSSFPENCQTNKHLLTIKTFYQCSLLTFIF